MKNKKTFWENVLLVFDPKGECVDSGLDEIHYSVSSSRGSLISEKVSTKIVRVNLFDADILFGIWKNDKRRKKIISIKDKNNNDFIVEELEGVYVHMLPNENGQPYVCISNKEEQIGVWASRFFQDSHNLSLVVNRVYGQRFDGVLASL